MAGSGQSRCRPFAAGTELRTRFAQVLELRDGKIVALRNYDCFYPW